MKRHFLVRRIRLDWNGAPTRLPDPIGSIEYVPANNHTPSGALLKARNKEPLLLIESVDDGQTTDAPTVTIIQSNQSSALAIFGGCALWGISSMGQARFNLFRERDYEEYWESAFIETAFGLLIVYESGLLMLDSDLHVLWHRPKYFNDGLVGIEGDHATLLGEDGLATRIDLRDGSTSPE